MPRENQTFDVSVYVPSMSAKKAMEKAFSFFSDHFSFCVDIHDDEKIIAQVKDLKPITWPVPQRFGFILDKIFMQINQCNRAKKIEIGSAILDIDRLNYLNSEKNESVKLTEKEAEILLFLYNSDNVVAREDLLKHVWGFVDGLETHTVETHIYRLRQKIEDDPSNPKILVTNEEGYFLKR